MDNHLVNLKQHSTPKKKQSSRFWFFILVILAFICWFRSDYWPWPSEKRREERLDRVVDVCTDNENSSECKSLKDKFGITFRYCEEFSFDIFEKNIYAVAWEGNGSMPPNNKPSNPYGIPSLEKYRTCKDHLSEF